jgi:uncharacterized membrane protein YphA (DoxX/SURF4 family)
MAGLRVLAIAMGLFLLSMGTAKLDWLWSGDVLKAQLDAWLETGPPASRWYLANVAIPGVPVFARLVVLGELAVGAALVCGYRVRISAAIALLMVLNFHFASGLFFQYTYLRNSYGPPVIGSLLALAIGGKRLPNSVSRH